MAKYKIVKKPGLYPHLDRYKVYRKFLGLFWYHIGTDWSLREAEDRIASDKRYTEYRKKKSEVVGYY